MTDQHSSQPKNNNKRTASWLELFFDLIFVVAIAKASHVLLNTHNGYIDNLLYLKYVLIMIPIWWAWTGATLYSSRFDCDDTLQRLMTFTQMFCVILLAANINLDFDSYYRGFLFSYLAIRLLTVLMYLRVSYSQAEKRFVSNYLALIFSAGILISLISICFDGLLRYFLLYFGIVFDIVMTLLAKKRLNSIPVNSHHLPERYGLLTIILLGEAVLSLTNSFKNISWSLTSIAMACSGFILTCSIWWLYFDNLDQRIAGKHLGHGQGIIFSHLFIYLGLGGIAAMVYFSVIPGLNLLGFKGLSAFAIFSFLLAQQTLQIFYHSENTKRHLIVVIFLSNLLLAVLITFANSIPFVMLGTTILVLIYLVFSHYRLQNI